MYQYQPGGRLGWILSVGFFPYLIINHLLMPVVLFEHRKEFYDIRVLSNASKSTVYKERYVLTSASN